MKIGDSIIFVDENSHPHAALITIIHGPADENPAINLVYVSGDETKSDPYGRQIERKTSVVHQSKQGANGMFWSEHP